MRALVVVALVCSGCAKTAFFSSDEAERICMTWQVCAPLEFTVRFGRDMEACASTPVEGLPVPGAVRVNAGLAPAFRELYSCLLAARGDCAKADQCWSADPSRRGSCTNRFQGLFSFTCEGDVLTTCTRDGQRFAADCSRWNMTCSSGDGSLGIGAACTPGCSVERCEGNVAQRCAGDVPFTQDCARTGEKCVVTEGKAQCVAPASGELCTLRCEGSVVVSQCGSARQTFDCASELPTSPRCEQGQCVRNGMDCPPGSALCVGEKALFCRDGADRQFDCVAEGFGPCVGQTCSKRP